MMTALLKRQLLEAFSWIYENRRSGKRRDTRGMILCAGMYLGIFVFLGMIFFMLADGLYAPLAQANALWIYWALMGLIALVLGVFGSVFNTYSSLYQAKDNDFLLAMPIAPARVVLARLSGVYVVGLMYELIVAVPAMIVWLTHAPLSGMGVVATLLLPLILSLLVLVLSAVLGWVVALVAGKIRHKNLVIVLMSIAFIVLYYYAYARAYALIQRLIMNIAALQAGLRVKLYPLYCMGMAAQGSVKHLLMFAGASILLTLLVCVLLSVSFLRLTTNQRGMAKARQTEKFARQRSRKNALLRRELARFTGSANYMLNCGLGVILMPVGALALWWKADTLRQMLSLLPDPSWAALLAAAAVCASSTLCDMTAPSISLEGKNLPLIQALPVDGREVLLAKLKLHLLLTLPSAAVLIGAMLALLRPAMIYWVLIPIVAAFYIILIAALGLTLNLKLPNLNWSSEIVPIKQGASVSITLFGGWLIVAGLAGLFILLRTRIAASVYLGICCALLLVADALLLRWLKQRGARIFEEL